MSCVTLAGVDDSGAAKRQDVLVALVGVGFGLPFYLLGLHFSKGDLGIFGTGIAGMAFMNSLSDLVFMGWKSKWGQPRVLGALVLGIAGLATGVALLAGLYFVFRQLGWTHLGPGRAA
jgi:hypothetical protein